MIYVDEAYWPEPTEMAAGQYRLPGFTPARIFQGDRLHVRAVNATNEDGMAASIPILVAVTIRYDTGLDGELFAYAFVANDTTPDDFYSEEALGDGTIIAAYATVGAITASRYPLPGSCYARVSIEQTDLDQYELMSGYLFRGRMLYLGLHERAGPASGWDGYSGQDTLPLNTNVAVPQYQIWLPQHVGGNNGRFSLTTAAGGSNRTLAIVMSRNLGYGVGSGTRNKATRMTPALGPGSIARYMFDIDYEDDPSWTADTYPSYLGRLPRMELHSGDLTRILVVNAGVDTLADNVMISQKWVTLEEEL